MLYEEARVYLDHVSKYGSVLGLESIKGLLGELKNPQKDLTFIHIAGTNGKGSILAYLSGIFKEAGYRTGSYISPTVMDYLERFQIDGKYMEETEFAEITCEVKQAAERMMEQGRPSPTVFEMETAIAFLYFKKRKCDFVVLETGLGGLLDATNIVDTTKVCVFASISMDHIGVLGDNLKEIAKNKAGIIKAGAAVVTAPQQPEVLEILERTAVARHARAVVLDRLREEGDPNEDITDANEKFRSLTVAEPEKVRVLDRGLDGQTFSYKEFENMTIPLLGHHQIENVVTALEVVRVLRTLGAEKGVPVSSDCGAHRREGVPESSDCGALRRESSPGLQISDEAVRRGLAKTRWPGRFTVLGKQPLVIADGAHNADAARRLAENVETYLAGKRVTAVMGVFKDKEYEKIIEIMSPYLSFVYTVDLPNQERTLAKEELCGALGRHGIAAEAAAGTEEALHLAKKRAGEDGAVLVFGSLSYLGDVIRLEENAAGAEAVDADDGAKALDVAVGADAGSAAESVAGNAGTDGGKEGTIW